jgi:hypothetical protein
MFYENVLRTLQKNNVRHAVAGGVALVLHGVVRFTARTYSEPIGSGLLY